MRTLSTPVSNAASATQSFWAEVYDFYLKTSVSTPWGTTNIIRLTQYPGGMAFYTPSFSPEPSPNTAAQYYYWPILRESSRANRRFSDDRLTLTLSNVTTDFASIVASIDFRDTPVIIRKVPTVNIAVLTAGDCVTVFSGLVRQVALKLDTISLVIDSDIGNFGAQLPLDSYHTSCRFRFGDDRCGLNKYGASNAVAGCVAAPIGIYTDYFAFSGAGPDTGTINHNGTPTYGTDLVNALADSNIGGTTFTSGNEFYRIKASYGGDWYLSNLNTQWGDLTQGYWTIPDAQAGVGNPDLRPYIRINFGAAQYVRTWRFMSVPGVGREGLVKLLQISNSLDDINYTFRAWFQMPAIGGTLFDCQMPDTSDPSVNNRQYWRIAIRTRYATGFWQPGFRQISAYADGFNYWRGGYIVFDPTTTTPALRNVSREVAASGAGFLKLSQPLPVQPTNTDTFSIFRGCQRTFNACAERANWGNYGGFPEVGQELQADASGTNQTAGTTGTSAGGRRQTP
jgi:hypothetical protein